MVANVLLDKQVIINEIFTALLLMAVGSTMPTVPLVTTMLLKMKAVLGKGSCGRLLTRSEEVPICVCAKSNFPLLIRFGPKQWLPGDWQPVLA
jgi:hypothetical protein